MFQLSDQTIKNQEIILTNDQVNYLGHNLILENCRLIIRASARNLVIARTKLINCTVLVRRKLFNFGWYDAWLEGCTFEGKMIGNDFGHWTELDPEGGIVDCDFSNAMIDQCRFSNCDMNTIRLPEWPCITFLSPGMNAPQLLNIVSPVDLRFTVEGLVAQVEKVVAVTKYAATVLKYTEGTEDDLKTILEQFDFIRM
jgi:hypothetical protein